MITIDEMLEIDRLVLRDHCQGGSPLIDLETHRAVLEKSKSKSQFAVVRRKGAVAAYGYLWPLEKNMWFVGGIAIRPNCENPSVIRGLAARILSIVEQNDIRALRSNVFKANGASVNLHSRLGFVVTQSSDIGFEFTLRNLKPLKRYGSRRSMS
jgi:L-amino acid N-acyltransferase YncA